MSNHLPSSLPPRHSSKLLEEAVNRDFTGAHVTAGRPDSAEALEAQVGGVDVTLPVSVDITIEHLSIEGFGRRDGFTVRRALQRNLVRLIQDHGLPDGWATDTAREDVVATGLSWDGHGGEDGLAAALARQIYEAFGS